MLLIAGVIDTTTHWAHKLASNSRRRSHSSSNEIFSNDRLFAVRLLFGLVMREIGSDSLIISSHFLDPAQVG